MEITTDGFTFDFPKAINVFKFDEENKSLPTFHGASHAMMGVDIMVELPDRYLFIEIKNPKNGAADYAPKKKCKECGHKENPTATLVSNLTRKCRDTWLYRFCEDKIDKPCHFICLITLDDAMLLQILTLLRNTTPDKMPARWKHHFIESVSAVNPAAWQRNFSKIYGTCKKA